MPLMVMANEHGILWRLMTRSKHRWPGPTPIGTRCGRRAASCWKRLDQHNGKEEPVVYPRAAVDLSDEVADALAEHLRTARTPDGWVCEAIR